MLTTIVLGLFVLLGFVFNEKVQKNINFNKIQFIVAGLFILTGVTSIYFGYVARLETFRYVNAGINEFSGVESLIGWQAMSLHISAVCTSYLVASTLVAHPSRQKCEAPEIPATPALPEIQGDLGAEAEAERAKSTSESVGAAGAADSGTDAGAHRREPESSTD